MLWGDPPGWEAMLVVVLGHLGIEVEDQVIVVVADRRQFMARDFLTGCPSRPPTGYNRTLDTRSHPPEREQR